VNCEKFRAFEVLVMGKLTTIAAILLFSYTGACGSLPAALAEEAAKNPGSSAGSSAGSGAGHSETKPIDSWAPVKVENKEGSEYCSINDPMQKSQVKFACINHHPDCAEAEEVIQTLAIYAKAYVSQDYKTCAEYMAEGITTFDEHTKKLIVGREAVLADMKERLDKAAPDSDSPLVSYTIDNPVALVKGNSATVCCIGIKVYGGKHPRTMESHSSYVFIKEDGRWKKSHFRTDWKQVENKKS
jgi:ketosteroid isomerase-like protein